MGLLDNFNFDDPKTMGLLSAAAQMLQASGPSLQPTSFGQVLGQGFAGGMQGYQGALDNTAKMDERRQMAEYRQAQAGQFAQKTASDKSHQDALNRIRNAVSADPNYKPNFADMMDIDPSGAVKGLMPGSGVDHGLNPKIGRNPTTGKLGYFIQDKQGGTKWIDAGVPDALKFVQGNEYKPDRVFDPREGIRDAPNQQPMPMSGAQPSSQQPPQSMPQADPLAPWRNIVSPKEQDQMRGRTYDQDNKRLDDLRKQIHEGKATMKDLDRFGALNSEQETGGIIDRIPGLPTFDTEKREMEAIQSRLAPSMRQPGSGASSDRDVNLFLAALPGTDKEGAVNNNIRTQFARQLQDAQEVLAFREKYLTEKGHLAGVEDAYGQSKKDGTGDGLDISRISPEHQAFLQQQDPQAFANGMARFNQQTAPPSPAANAPPREAINMLKMNPKLRDAFDAKYGPGASQSVLGR